MARRPTEIREEQIKREIETLQEHFLKKILPAASESRQGKGAVDAVATFRADMDFTLISLRVEPNDAIRIERLNKEFSLFPDDKEGLRLDKPHRVELDHVKETLAALNHEFHLATPKFRAVVPRGQTQAPIAAFQYDYTVTNNRKTIERIETQKALDVLGLPQDLDFDK